jgi:hypothetical protein
MTEDELAVLRFLDGRVLKGHISRFSEEEAEVTLREAETGGVSTVNVDSLKAIFFVRSLEGNRKYNERKSFGIRRPRGRRTFIRFNDGEDMVGFLEGDVPWDKGFFLSKQNMKKLKGFYLLPADEGSNNIRVFIFTSAVRDVTVVP